MLPPSFISRRSRQRLRQSVQHRLFFCLVLALWPSYSKSKATPSQSFDLEKHHILAPKTNRYHGINKKRPSNPQSIADAKELSIGFGVDIDIDTNDATDYLWCASARSCKRAKDAWIQPAPSVEAVLISAPQQSFEHAQMRILKPPMLDGHSLGAHLGEMACCTLFQASDEMHLSTRTLSPVLQLAAVGWNFSPCKAVAQAQGCMRMARDMMASVLSVLRSMGVLHLDGYLARTPTNRGRETSDTNTTRAELMSLLDWAPLPMSSYLLAARADRKNSATPALLRVSGACGLKRRYRTALEQARLASRAVCWPRARGVSGLRRDGDAAFTRCGGLWLPPTVHNM